MNAEMSCERVQGLAAELALDIVPVDERDAALRHLPGCPACRQVVSEMVSAGEELLSLAPPQEPPVGFESRVVATITGSARPVRARRRPRSAAGLAAAAAIVLAAVLGAGSVFVAATDDRELAASYREVLAEGRGSFFAAASLEGPDGAVGSVFGYEGDPSWVVATIRSPIDGARPFEVRLETRDGRVLDLGRSELGGVGRVWAQEIPVSLPDVVELRFVADDDTATTLTATFDAASPWG
jgi:hypothetical protein